MNCCADGCQLVHRSIAEVLAADPHGGKHDGERARRQYVRKTDVPRAPDTMSAAPRSLRAIALEEGDRVARDVTRCGDAQSVQVAGRDDALDATEVDHTAE